MPHPAAFRRGGRRFAGVHGGASARPTQDGRPSGWPAPPNDACLAACQAVPDPVPGTDAATPAP